MPSIAVSVFGSQILLLLCVINDTYTYTDGRRRIWRSLCCKVSTANSEVSSECSTGRASLSARLRCKNCISHTDTHGDGWEKGAQGQRGAGLPSFERARTAAGGWLLRAAEGVSIYHTTTGTGAFYAHISMWSALGTAASKYFHIWFHVPWLWH